MTHNHSFWFILVLVLWCTETRGDVSDVSLLLSSSSDTGPEELLERLLLPDWDLAEPLNRLLCPPASYSFRQCEEEHMS